MGFRNPIRRLSELVADRVIGALVATAETGIRTAMQGTGLKFYSGDPAEVTPASIAPGVAGSGVGELRMLGADMGGGAVPGIILQTQDVIGGFLARLFIGTAAGVDLVQIGGAAADVSLTGLHLDLNPTGVGADKGVSIGGGTPVKAMTYGRANLTTNATGEDNVPHGLGAAPDCVLVTGALAGMQNNKLRVTATSPTTFTVELRNSSTNTTVPAGTPFTVYWQAIR